MKAKILIVDDDRAICDYMQTLLERDGYAVKTLSDPTTIEDEVKNGGYHLIILDLMMPKLDGIEVLRRIRKLDTDIAVVIFTGFPNLESAVASMKLDAVDYIKKPFRGEELILKIQMVLESSQTKWELEELKSKVRVEEEYKLLFSLSDRMSKVQAIVDQVANTDITVLISGESGTGKELVARAIHHASARADGPFVAVNCAALPDTLLESELFGHERGAFTGADRQKPGRFELAAGGTLFLDEIGDLSAAVQVKLLRVLQEREYQRVGGTATLKADVRLLTATNRDLTAEMAAGRFRSDLFYRLSVFNVHLPPLRERADDVLLLADHFIRTLGPQMGKGDLTLSRDACEVLRRHPWPGNIRELQNAIERSLITSEGTLITAAHLALQATPVPTPAASVAPPAVAGAPPSSLDALERQAIVEALQRAHGHKSRAAALLGLTRFQLYTRLKRYAIEVTPD